MKFSTRRRGLFSVVFLILLWCSAAGVLAQAGPEGSHKVVAEPHLLDGPRKGVTLIEDYGSFGLYRLTPAALERTRDRVGQDHPGLRVVDHTDRILIDSFPVDVHHYRPQAPAHLRRPDLTDGTLRLIQFVGPIKEQWLEDVRHGGARPIHYVSHNAYLVYVPRGQGRAVSESLRAHPRVQFEAAYEPFFKLGPTLRDQITELTEPDKVLPVTIQMVRHEGKAGTMGFIKEKAVSIDSDWSPILEYQNLVAHMRLGDVAELVRRGDVYWVEQRLPREKYDEVQDQIVAGNFNGAMTGPSGTGYRAWLDSFGFSTNPADYPIVDVTDDGIGNGTVNSGDPTLHVSGLLANATRLNHVGDCTANSNGEGPDGHGHINVSIVGGFDERSGFPFQDPNGYQRGMGINPYGRMGGTRIFGPGYDISACGGTDAGVILENWTQGSRISSNSWGCSGCAGSYDDGSQAYDAGTRDADPGTAGNQELLFLFAAGNSGSGAGTVGTPGNGKNMITVGASENDRPSDEDGNWSDGCGIGSTGADSAMDVISFSSRGPSPGNRVKPEVIAPGTHIQGTASTNASYNGSGVCDQYRPSGQTTFAASSGTSHSTPAAAGVASLYYWWLENTHGFSPPSPALIKAYMMAHPTYLTGVSANDTLPSNNQGYGMPNMGMAFDSTVRYMIDQTQVFDNTGENWVFNGSIADPAKPVYIILNYTDAAGAVGTSPQVNDLNLQAVINGTDTYLGNVFSGQWSTTGGSADALNNYEGIFLPAGTSGSLDITISAANIAGDGIPNVGDGTDQDFALVCYNCAQFPDFTLQVSPTSRDVCAPSDTTYDINIGSILAYNEPVTLTTSGLPAGATDSFTVNPVIPAGTSQLTIGNTGAVTPGSYSFDVDGLSSPSGDSHSRTVDLNVFDAAPAAPTLLTPADGATLVPPAATFTWTAPAQAATFEIDIATDSGFTTIVDSATGLANPTYTSSPLSTNTEHFWRVRAVNPCGNGTWSGTFDFITEPAPGDCTFGITPNNIFTDDFESGVGSWTTGGTGDTWALSGAQVNSGASAFFGQNVATASDQYLISPVIALPAGQAPLTLQFYNYQNMETSSGGCYDAGVIEISTDGGGLWNRLEAEIIQDSYDGAVSTCCSNALAGDNAWCSGSAWVNAIVDIDAYAGQNAQFRWRLGTDTSVSAEGWYVDDVKVQSCPDPGTTLAVDDVRWSDAAAPGNNNGVAEPGELITIEIDITNTGQTTSANTQGTLSLTGGVGTVPVNMSAYNDVAQSAIETNTTTYRVLVDAGHACGDDLDFQHVVAYDVGGPLTHNFTLSTGTGGTVTNTYSYAGGPVAIPDGDTNGVDSQVAVGDSGPIADVNVSVDITHTWVGDLVIELTSPTGTPIVLSNRNGSTGDNYTGTIFDDEASTPIGSGAAPFTGSFIPDNPLSGFDSEEMNGNWILNVSDHVSADSGTVDAWSITIDSSTPQVCDPPAAATGPPPVPNGDAVSGTPLSADRLNQAGDSLQLYWDTATCTSTDYNMIWGFGSQLPSSVGGVMNVTGSSLGMGTNGSTGHNWTSVPDPGTDGSRFLWWIITGTDGSGVEGSWGPDSAGNERLGPGTNGSSGQGAYDDRDLTTSTCS